MCEKLEERFGEEYFKNKKNDNRSTLAQCLEEKDEKNEKMEEEGEEFKGENNVKCQVIQLKYNIVNENKNKEGIILKKEENVQNILQEEDENKKQNTPFYPIKENYENMKIEQKKDLTSKNYDNKMKIENENEIKTIVCADLKNNEQIYNDFNNFDGLSNELNDYNNTENYSPSGIFNDIGNNDDILTDNDSEIPHTINSNYLPETSINNDADNNNELAIINNIEANDTKSKTSYNQG